MNVPSPAIVTWGSGPEVDRAVADVMSQHAKEWHRQQRAEADAQAIGDLVRDAVLQGVVTQSAVTMLLVAAPPPPMGMRQRLVAAVRLIVKGNSHA